MNSDKFVFVIVCCVFVNVWCSKDEEKELWEKMVAYVSMGRKKQ